MFPCKTGGKEPLTKRGYLDATTDPEKVRAWWTRWPTANIGIPTGERSGLLVLDVDNVASLEILEAEHGELPTTTTTARTGSGGIHVYFRYPAGAIVRNSAGKLGPGLDVRGEGGYVIAPPSRTTGPYEWLEKKSAADLPEWLTELLTRPPRPADKPSANRTSSPIPAGETIPEGERNAGLTRVAGRLRARGYDGAELLSELERINDEQCSSPLPDPEVLKIARSAERWPMGNAKPGPGPEVLETLESVEAALWRRPWPGMGGKSERDVLVALLKIARQHGEKIPAGVRFTVDYRTIALAAATGVGTAHRAIQRLRRKDLVRYDNLGMEDGDAGALVIVARKVEHSNHQAPPVASGVSVPPCAPPAHQTLTAPRLRWSAPEIRRLGKSCGQAVDVLERAGGTLTIEELAEAMEIKRSRDLKRRILSRLEAAAVVICTGNNITLSPDWLEALNIERERAGEIERYRLDVARYARDREAYARRHEHSPEAVPAMPKRREPAERPIGELERLDAPRVEKPIPPVECGSKTALEILEPDPHNTSGSVIAGMEAAEADPTGPERREELVDLEDLAEDLGLEEEPERPAPPPRRPTKGEFYRLPWEEFKRLDDAYERWLQGEAA